MKSLLKPAPYCLLALLLPLAAFAQNPDLYVCAGKGYTLKSPPGNDAAGSALTFTWYEKAGSGAYNSIAATTASSYHVPAKSTGGTYSYVRWVASAECQGVPSNTYTVAVLAPAAPTITAPPNVCRDAGSLVFAINNYSPPGSTGSTFTWTGASVGTPSGAGNSTYTVPGNSAAQTYALQAAASVTYSVGTMTKTCTSGTSTVAQAAVNPLPTVTQSGASTFCGSGAKELTVNASVDGGVSVAWYTDSNPGSTVSNTTSCTVSASTVVGTYTYYVQATANTTQCKAAATVTAIRTLTEGKIGGGILQPQGNCTFTQPAGVSTFADFPADYGASTFVSLIDERDRKIYTAVKIGGRWWMGQNLNYQIGLTYWDKHSMPTTSLTPLSALRGGFWCPTNNENSTPVSVCDYWGALYAWETAMMLDGKGTWTDLSATTYCTGAATSTECQINYGRSASSGTAIGGRGICPPNWHVPTDFELAVLYDAMESSQPSILHQSDATVSSSPYLGSDAGTRAKASCGTNSGDSNPSWVDNTVAGTDNYNFRGVPADDRNANGGMDDGRGKFWIPWTSSPNSSDKAIRRALQNTSTQAQRHATEMAGGNSVRCVRD